MTSSDRRRASPFDLTDPAAAAPPERKIDLSRFTSQKPPEVDETVLKQTAAAAGFTTSHAKQPAPKRDGRKLKKSPRTAQFNVRLSPDTVDRFWAAAEEAGHTFADDMLAELLTLYAKHKH